MPPTHMLNAKALYTTIPIKKTLTLLICDHPGVLRACTVHSTFLILSRAPVNRGLPSIVGADKARWHTPRPIVRARWVLVLWPPGLEGRLAHL